MIMGENLGSPDRAATDRSLLLVVCERVGSPLRNSPPKIGTYPEYNLVMKVFSWILSLLAAFALGNGALFDRSARRTRKAGDDPAGHSGTARNLES